ncbi:MAG: DUF4178 domain-containing protein [Desulfobacter sp.]|nr:MAG: DUF4178 domain-containing protein [Desulfobacter sp.]
MLSIIDTKSFDQRFSLIRTLSPERLVSQQEASELTIMDAQKGDFFNCFGDTYYIKEKTIYQETSEDFATPQDYSMTELTCLCLENGHTGHFEWEYDDELSVSITLNQTKFKRLADEEGQAIDEDDLDQIVEDEDTIVYAGEKFFYEDDWAAVYQRDNKQEQVYMYEFENDSGTLSITIEEWKGSAKDEYKIYISKPIVPEEITIMTKGVAGDENGQDQ